MKNPNNSGTFRIGFGDVYTTTEREPRRMVIIDTDEGDSFYASTISNQRGRERLGMPGTQSRENI